MFSISIYPKLNTTVMFFTLGAYDQCFGFQMQKNSDKWLKLQKITQCALSKGQGGDIGKVFLNNF
jgi:hypothetical protein